MTVAPAHEPLGKHRSKKAATNGWIGSALEYYDFFICATAAALIFPQIFFPKGDPKTAIIASLTTYGVGYITWPIGAFVLGHLSDTYGRRSVLLWYMFLIDFSTIVVGLLPTYDQVGLLAPTLLIVMRLIQGFTVAGEVSGVSSMILEHTLFGRRGFYASSTLQGVQARQILAAAVFPPLAHYMPVEQFNTWGWRISFMLSFVAIIANYVIRHEMHETPTFTAEREQQTRPRSPVINTFKYSTPSMLRVICMAPMNAIPVMATIFGAAYTVQLAYSINFTKDIYLRTPMVGDITTVLVIPYVGDLSDRAGRKSPIVIGSLLVGLLALAYLYAISTKNIPLAFAVLILMWGVVYQGYNAVFPSFYPELFPTRTRVSAVAISRDIGTAIAAMLPAILTAIAPPGTTNIRLTVNAIAFGVIMVAAAVAMNVHETHRIHMDELGQPTAQLVGKAEYARQRAGAPTTWDTHT